MNLAHLFEAGMLVCFGFSWPLNVIKAYKAKTAKGTSLAFIILIITGYVAGITAKVINQQFNYVLGVYFLNLAIVMTNVLVYIRNKALDKKAAEKGELRVNKIDIKAMAEAKEDDMLNYSNSLDEIINKTETTYEEKNSVLLLGGKLDKEIPVAQLSKDFDFNFNLYNKSQEGLSLKNASEYFVDKIAPLFPEGLILHLGEDDLSLFANDSDAFDNYYMTLISQIKAVSANCRIALVSVSNPERNKTINLMNAHIKAIASAEKCAYVNIDNDKLWNPEATKASSDFAYSMGLRIRKPLRDVAEILYSYAYNNIAVKELENLVG